MSLPAITWLCYAVPAYLLWPVVFRFRYGRSPLADRFPPRDLYSTVDFLLALCLIGYSAWIVLGPPPAPISTATGLGLFGTGFLLRVWAVISLGPHWRIGQDTHDATTSFVSTGPYRFLDHPINTALILVAIGQSLMTGLDARAMFLLAFSVVYFFAQAGAESRYWAQRRRSRAGRADGP
ncbi:MAG: hypothetical protein KF745_12240 [Phycisphaeraceae bacterium]|nr:hypothetical protein [Phycisphaeraceae bacterium]